MTQIHCMDQNNEDPHQKPADLDLPCFAKRVEKFAIATHSPLILFRCFI